MWQERMIHIDKHWPSLHDTIEMKNAWKKWKRINSYINSIKESHHIQQADKWRGQESNAED
jgi:hypothetical protein